MSTAVEVRQARLAAGLTQERLARRARTSQAAVSDYESGKRIPEPATLARLLWATRPLPSTVLDQQRAKVVAIAAEHGVTRLRVFGSVALGRDGPDSDIDLLADVPADMSALAFVALCEELEALLGTHVDLVADHAIPADDPIRSEALAL